MPAMTQHPTWAATIAPIDRPGSTGQTIDPQCVITVRDGAPLFDHYGVPIGRVTGATVVDGYVVATGTLDPGRDLPDAAPTFDADTPDPSFGHVDGDVRIVSGRGRPDGTVTFTTLEIYAVRSGFEPAWSDPFEPAQPDPQIMFSRDWCVHIVGPDDLIAMPDYATAERAAGRFNDWWKRYLEQRGETDGVGLPESPAVVRPWPYSTGHPEALAELQADDPDGWLSD